MYDSNQFPENPTLAYLGINLTDVGEEIAFSGNNVTDESRRTINCEVVCNKYIVESYNEPTITYADAATGVGVNFTWKTTDAGRPILEWAASTADFGGARSTAVFAFHNDGQYHNFFTCNSTVLKVEKWSEHFNSDLYDLPDRQAKIFAGSIGGEDPDINGMLYSSYDTTSGTTYPAVLGDFEHEGEELDFTPEDIAHIIKTYSLAAIGAYDRYGPRVPVQARQPMQAQSLKVYWNWAGAILGVIPFTQLVLLIVVALRCSRTVIKDTSYLAAAQLLRPVVDQLGSHGCILSGKEIAQHLGNMPITYGIRYPASDSPYPVYHVDIIRQSEAGGLGSNDGWAPGMKMPKGWYDGLVCNIATPGSLGAKVAGDPGRPYQQRSTNGFKWKLE